jgi:hypothetical protein
LTRSRWTRGGGGCFIEKQWPLCVVAIVVTEGSQTQWGKSGQVSVCVCAGMFCKCAAAHPRPPVFPPDCAWCGDGDGELGTPLPRCDAHRPKARGEAGLPTEAVGYPPTGFAPCLTLHLVAAVGVPVGEPSSLQSVLPDSTLGRRKAAARRAARPLALTAPGLARCKWGRSLAQLPFDLLAQDPVAMHSGKEK